MTPTSQAEIVLRIAIGALIGLAAGLEREWSGHATGPRARFAGLRTFFLLGLLGGVAGVLAAQGELALASGLAVGGAALCVSAYVMAVRRTTGAPDGTTEAAALVVIALGVLAGAGWRDIATGAGAIVVLMLSEKARLHWLVARLGEPEFRAGLQFAVLAVVVLPLLPAGPFFGDLAFQPRSLWAIVLVLTGLNFVGFLARRVAGATRGLAIVGALGGVISSTAVTLSFSRQSARDERLGLPLARGVAAASTIVIPRMLLVATLFNPMVAAYLVPLLVPQLIVGGGFSVLGWGRTTEPRHAVRLEERNPLHLWSAIRMAALFQSAMWVITLVRRFWGTTGLYATSAFLGLVDVDALTISTARRAADLVPMVAARAIALGLLANTLFRFAVAVALGRGEFRRRAAGSLIGLALASALGLLLA
ncbi:MAG TPA: MgtC/SapB family protein [Gemmatimonadaceae bacterium]|nr:MgtC/SapB family protein [Gemmatimonadaceae bacterium]